MYFRLYELEVDEVSEQYPQFMVYVRKLVDRKAMWALANRQLHGQHTNNIVEAAMRIVKDVVFERTRAFNVVQMTEFLLYRLSDYYRRRLLDTTNTRAGCPKLASVPERSTESVVQ